MIPRRRQPTRAPRAATVLIAIGVLFGVALLGGGLAAGAPGHVPNERPADRPTPAPYAIVAPGTGARNLYTSHWYAGAYYGGTSGRATRIQTNLTVPDAQPSTSEFYYVLLSVWDSAGSYDQLGFTNDYGVWGLSWSYTSACGGTYHYSPDQTSLSDGQTYTMSMSLSSGSLTYNVTDGGSTVWTSTKTSGGGYFVVAGFYTCSGSSYYDYTDYEEHYATVQSVPSFSFFFPQNEKNGSAVSSWNSFTTSSFPGSVLLTGSSVTIANEPVSLSFGAGGDGATVAPGTTVWTNVTMTRLWGTHNEKLTVSGQGSRIAVSLSNTTGKKSFSSTVTITVGSSAAPGLYGITITVNYPTGKNYYTYVTFELGVS